MSQLNLLTKYFFTKLPDTPQKRDASLRTLAAKERGVTNMLENKQQFKDGDPWMLQLQNSILSGRFWGSLYCIDGSDNTPRPRHPKPKGYRWEEKMIDGVSREIPVDTFDPQEMATFEHATKEWHPRQLMDQQQAWTRNNFSHDELERILDVVINQALLKPRQGYKPGFERGHSILYRDIVERDSIFRASISEEFVTQMHNGRFWEALPNCQYALDNGMHVNEVYDVLTNHFAALDATVAHTHMKKVGYFDKLRFGCDLSGMGGNALLKYAEFMDAIETTSTQIDEWMRETVPTKTMNQLMRPYIRAALSWDGDWELPEYSKTLFDVIKSTEEELEPGYSLARSVPDGVTYQQLLSAPAATRYLQRVSRDVQERDFLVGEFRSMVRYQANDLYRAEHVAAMLDTTVRLIPEQKHGDRAQLVSHILIHDNSISKAAYNVIAAGQKSGTKLHEHLRY